MSDMIEHKRHLKKEIQEENDEETKAFLINEYKQTQEKLTELTTELRMIDITGKI